MSRVSLSWFFLASSTSQKRSGKPQWSLPDHLLTFSAVWASTPPSFCFSPVFLSSLDRWWFSILFAQCIQAVGQMNHVTSLKCDQVAMKDDRNKNSGKIYDNLSLGSFEGLQHNPQPQLSFDTLCKKVSNLSSQTTPQGHFLPGLSSVAPCQISHIWESFQLDSSSCGTVQHFYHTLWSGTWLFIRINVFFY